MKVGELFLDVSLNGANKVSSGLSGIKNWLTDVSAGGVAAKAAILGAFYALQRLTRSSGAAANDLTNFSLLTGLDPKPIQQWSEYMRKSGATAEDATSSLLAAQKTATQIQLGNVPAGLAWISKATHVNLMQHLNDPLVFADTVRKYIETTKDSVGLANEMAESVGFTPGSISASRKNHEDIYKIRANIASGGEVARRTQVNQEWSNLDKSFSRFRDVLTAKWGLPIVHELNVLLGVVKELAMWIDHATKSLTDFRGVFEPVMGQTPAPGIGNSKEPESDFSKRARDFLQGLFGAPPTGLEKESWHAPMKVPVISNQPVKNNQTSINVYQHGVKDSHESVSSFQKDISRAWNSISTKDTKN